MNDHLEKNDQESYESQQRRLFVNYSKKRHLELVKKKYENMSQSEEDFMELLQYSAFIEGHLNWETKDQYLELVEQFLNDKISISYFCIEFSEIRSRNCKAIFMLESSFIILSPHEKSFDFTDFIEGIYWACEQFDGDEENSENRFRNLIEKIFLEIQKYLDE